MMKTLEKGNIGSRYFSGVLSVVLSGWWCISTNSITEFGVHFYPGTDSSSSFTTTLNKMGEEDRPQIPPQLLYLHRLASLKEKARNVHVAQSKEKNIPPVEENNNMMIVPPRMVQERRHRRKKQGQEGKSATPLKAGAVVVPLSSQQLQTLSPQQQLHTLASAVRSSVMSHKSDGKNLQQFLGNFRL